jgi:DNA-binding GntR family transcriptional regulator
MNNTFRDSPTPDVRSFRVEKVAAPLRHSVTESIRNGIALGYFKAGDRLPERTLCEMTGVSRTLVREALRQLESEGIIEVLPNRGPIVSVLSAKEAEDIYRVRVELEGLASELFALHASDEDRQKLSAAFDSLKKSMENPDPLERLKAKNWFYDCLFEGSGNKALGASLKMLNSRIVLLRATSLQAPGRTALSVAELHTLVDALLAKNATEARRAAVIHVQNAAEVAVKLLANAHSPDKSTR